MKTLSEIKKDMEFNSGLGSLIEVLKNIAVSQYHALENKIKSYDRFPAIVEGFFEFINLEKVSHPFLSPLSRKQMVVAITSDSGMLGGLNMQVVNIALRELEKIPGKLVIIGERGKNYARESGVPFTAFSGIIEEERHTQAMQLRGYLLSTFLQESMGYLKVVYPRPVSFTVQHVEMISFLPFAPPKSQSEPLASLPDIILESSLGDILEYLVYLNLGQRLYEIFGLSRLAEFAARFVHLEESSDRLREMDKKLKLQYFRIRHELIDRNMRELFAARLLYAS
jgi:ATP synthase F1 gamma subunit